MEKIDFAEIARRWPSPFVARQEVGKLTGGLVKPKTLANEDSLGTGPKGRFKFGRKTGYTVLSFIDWMIQRAGEE